MPGADQVVRQPAAQVETEEAGQIGAVVLAGRAHQGLDDEQQPDHQEEVGARPLGGCDRDIVGAAERDGVGLATAPAHALAPAPERGEQHADAHQQHDQRQHAPDHDVGGHRVAHQRLRRPVVGVGVVLVRTQRRAGPRRPGEVRGELLDLGGVGDRLRKQALRGAVRTEVAGVVGDQLVERSRLHIGVGERVGVRVVPVGLEVGYHLVARGSGGVTAVLPGGDLRRAVQVVGGEVRPEVGAVAEDRAVLHQALAQEQLLPGDHVRTGVNDLSGGRQDPPSDRRVRRVSAIPEKTQDRQTTQQDQSRDLHPHPGNQAGTPRLDPRRRHGGSHQRAPRRSIKGKRW